MKAVVDRFENSYAVLLFGAEEIKVDIPKKLLPPGSKEGCWLTVSFEIDEEKTKGREHRIESLLQKLKKKGKGV